MCLSQFEWTLAARVNCTDDDPSQGVPIAPNTPRPCTDSVNSTASASDSNPVDSGYSPSPPVNGYFCVTAPVKRHPNSLDSKNPHYVCDYTNTIIVDLRYSFSPHILVPMLGNQVRLSSVCYLNDIADKVQEIVACYFKVKGDNFR